MIRKSESSSNFNKSLPENPIVRYQNLNCAFAINIPCESVSALAQYRRQQSKSPLALLLGIWQRHAANRALADAAKIKCAFMLDDVGDLREALRRRILEVVCDLSIGVEAERKRV